MSKLTSKIYTIGGFEGSERITMIEEYDIMRDKWAILNLNLKKGLTNSAAISIDDSKILVFGGS